MLDFARARAYNVRVSDELTDFLQAADAAYWAGEPVLSDLAYDTLRAALAVPEQVGPLQHVKKIDMLAMYPMLSLDKADARTLPVWLGSMGSAALLLEAKVDGVAVELHYEGGRLVHAVTRGDGHGGMDLMDLLSLTRWATADTAAPLTVHAELYVTRDGLARLGRERREYVSPRAAIGSIINLVDYSAVADVVALAVHDVVPVAGESSIVEGYARAQAAGLPLLPHAILHPRIVDLATLRSWYWAAVSDMPADGVVLKAVDLRTRERMGATATAPRWAVAVKDYTLAAC